MNQVTVFRDTSDRIKPRTKRSTGNGSGPNFYEPYLKKLDELGGVVCVLGGERHGGAYDALLNAWNLLTHQDNIIYRENVVNYLRGMFQLDDELQQKVLNIEENLGHVSLPSSKVNMFYWRDVRLSKEEEIKKLINLDLSESFVSIVEAIKRNNI